MKTLTPTEIGEQRAKLARLFGLSLAYDKRGLFPTEWLAPDMEPGVPGPWTVYRF